MSRMTDAKMIQQRMRGLTPEQRERLQRALMPRIVEPYIAHIPHPKQQVFLTLNCKEAMYGGAAGGGKSDAVLMAALQYVDVPGYSALILRRTWPDLNAPGAILDRARTWLAGTDAVQRDGGRLFVFPSGAKLTFGYMQRDADKYKFQSAEYQFIGFDELTHFEEGQYTYLFSRLRRPDLVCLNCGNAVRRYAGHKTWAHTGRKAGKRCSRIFPDPKVIQQYPPSEKDELTIFDIPLRMRSATNPGGIGNEWVKQRFVNPESREPDSVFVPAKLVDNPSLDRDSYRESLSHLTEVDRQRLENGDWDIAESGDFFKRHNFKVIDHPSQAERGEVRVRFWDLAATEGGGDWTAGCLLLFKKDGTYEVQDMVRVQSSGGKIESLIAQTAQVDGRDVMIRMEQEPGSSGKNIIDHYARNVLYGYDFDGVRSTGSKETRAYPVAVSSEKGHISIVLGEHTRAFLNELDAFPTGANDDMVDALSGAFAEAAFARRGRLLA
ncbi:terminase [Gordonia phage Kabocha]|nr:terminase [Gordonia phage Gray]WAA19803.1 terminase [Gordonia phage Kabocha]WAA19994.1 terminase [Gordonia phage Hanem]